MSSVEAARHALYSELERVLGRDHAKTLMTYLPQHPADEAATKSDIARLEASTKAEMAGLERRFDLRFSSLEERFDRMEERFDRFEARLDRVDERIDRMQRFYVGTTVWAMTGLTAIFSLVVAFLT
ncbi:MAG: hypothetical protein ACE5F5_04175 [Acidimicrobiia bacterium]